MRSHYIYIAPAIHLCVSLYATVGFYFEHAPEHPIWVLNVLTFLDFPVSIVGILLTWGPKFLAAAWMVIAGTLWWYFLSRCGRRYVRWLGSETGNPNVTQ